MVKTVAEGYEASALDVVNYTGHLHDDVLELYYAKARIYSPQVGRFTQEDPIRAGLNWYTYCGNNPIAFVDPMGLEQIVLSGGAYSDPNAHGGYKYNFTETAIKKLLELRKSNKDEMITWIIANEGWTTNDRKAFTTAMKGQNIDILYLSNADELVNYINSKDGQDIAGSTGQGFRSDDPITSFTVFSHGLVSDTGGVVSLGYNYSSDYNKNLNITTDHIARMSASAFSSPASQFYSCNTATAGDESFAYLWHQKFGGSVMAFHGKSDYGNIMYTKWYSKYNPTSWPEKIRIDNARKKYGFSISGSYYYPGTGANVVNYN